MIINLTDPDFVCQRASMKSQTVCVTDCERLVCKPLRELVLRNLQDFTARLMRIDADAPGLPRPIEIAHQAERQFVELLLSWESDIAHGYLGSHRTSSVRQAPQIQWIASAQARGQLSSLLHFLRCTGGTDGAARADVTRVRHMVRELERKRAQTAARERASAEAAARKQRTRVAQCLKHIQESAGQLEEILATLTNVLELLVPDPFADDSGSHASRNRVSLTDPQNSAVPADQLRLHGHILGSSSGMGLASAEGSIEIRLSGSTMCAGQPHIRVPVELDEDNKALADTAKEYARLARHKYRPLLADWIQVLESAKSTDLRDSNSNTSLTETLNRVQQWSTNVNQLTHLFFERIIWTKNGIPLTCDVTERPSATEHSEESSGENDFEEVIPFSTTSSVHQSELSEPAQHVDAKTEKTQSIQAAGTSDQNFDLILESRQHSHPSTPKLSNPYASNLAQELFDMIPSKSSVIWRANESAHRFWRPADPEEHEAPTEYMSEAISLCTDTPQTEMPTRSDTGLSGPPRPPEETEMCSDLSDNPVKVNQLACWAPLLSVSTSHSYRLCPRRDPSGRCPIHGRIVPRDPVTGRPVNPLDREQLQAEVVAVQQAKLEGKLVMISPLVSRGSVFSMIRCFTQTIKSLVHTTYIHQVHYPSDDFFIVPVLRSFIIQYLCKGRNVTESRLL
ncbi:hypothetical protein FGIG_07875 [Fasciola gigantica]|uniref:UV-stimulated scaffold protein A C-terminal domain-containing protein n=1 Tax=Fasciola gigantica TaxID=46835 RepID=A0A504YT76_FASGI|nr:hypothetical protein FGIG_07875 [Fasciola gigantica]